MDANTFKSALGELSLDDFQSILDGAALIVHQDEGLQIGKKDQAFVIYELGEDPFESPEALRAFLENNAEALVTQYYQFNPVSRESFNKQLKALMDEFGGEAFCAEYGRMPEKVLMVEADRVVAEDQNHPRFKYGLYLQFEEKLMPMAKTNKVKNWLLTGTAYEDYISTNVCRFSAME